MIDVSQQVFKYLSLSCRSTKNQSNSNVSWQQNVIQAWNGLEAPLHLPPNGYWSGYMSAVNRVSVFWRKRHSFNESFGSAERHQQWKWIMPVVAAFSATTPAAPKLSSRHRKQGMMSRVSKGGTMWQSDLQLPPIFGLSHVESILHQRW